MLTARLSRKSRLSRFPRTLRLISQQTAYEQLRTATINYMMKMVKVM